MQLFRHRTFRLLWLSQTITTLATELAAISLIVLIFTQTGSTLLATGVMIARNLPMLLLSPVAGSLVDRFSRRSVLFWAKIASTLLIGVSLLIGDRGGMWVGLGVIFGLTIIETLQKPAQLAILPTILAPSELVKANSLLFTSTYAAFTISYLLGGVLVTRIGANATTLIVLVGYVIAAVAVGMITASDERREERPQVSMWQSIRDGFSYLRKHQIARALLSIEFLECWPHGAWTSALMLAFTVQALNAGPEAWGYQNGAFFGGQLFGAIMTLFLARHLGQRPGWIIIANGFVMSALTYGYALSGNIPIAVIISAAFGPPFAMRDVAQDSLLQTTVDSAVLGRIYAAREMFSRAAFLMAGLLFAWLAEFVDARQAYLLAATLYALTSFYALANTALRQSRVVQATA